MKLKPVEHFFHKSENEVAAIGLINEFMDKYELFDECVVKKTLDEFGIDMILIKKLGKRGKYFRFHLQHKSSLSGANGFRKHNPCIPVWIVNKKTTSYDALVSLLGVIIEVTLKSRSSYVTFFIEKLEEIKKLHETDFQF